LGALDGKHIRIKYPAHGGSHYYNYKGYYLVVLLALVDADYKFLWVDAGCHGSNSDAQIFNGGALKAAIEDGTINFPPPEVLSKVQEEFPKKYPIMYLQMMHSP
jgi:hypothetical protein